MQAQLVLSTAGVYGLVTTGDYSVERYWIEPISGGLHVIAKIEDRGFPQDGRPARPYGDVGGSGPGAGSADQMNLTSIGVKSRRSRFGSPPLSDYTEGNLDVVVVYTAYAAGETEDIEALAQLAVDAANTTYSNSYISLTASLVHTSQITYDEDELNRTFYDHVYALQGTSDGEMDSVHSLRDQYLGDAVVLLVADTNDHLGGAAYTVLAGSADAFAVVRYDAAAGNWSLAHELGHLQGAYHDTSESATVPFAYGHGWRQPSSFRTVMAVLCPNSGPACPRAPYWSTPYYGPGPILTHGSADVEDNSRVLNETKGAITTLREPISVSILGPSTAISTQFYCAWDAVVSGGLPASSITWSGILSGSGSHIVGAVAESGYLYVTAYDSFSRYANAQIYVTVDDNGPGC